MSLAATAGLAVLLAMLAAERRTTRGKQEEGELFHRGVLVLGFLALPFLSFLAARIAHGWTTGYALPRWDEEAPLYSPAWRCASL